MNDIIIRRDYLTLLDGDLKTAALLSQVVYWFSPTEKGQSKLQVNKRGHFWIAKTTNEFMVECGLTRGEYIRSLNKLRELELLETQVMITFDKAQNHTRLMIDNLQKGLLSKGLKRALVLNPDIQLSTIKTSGSTVCEHPIYTESTSESTSEKELASQNPVKTGKFKKGKQEDSGIMKKGFKKASGGVDMNATEMVKAIALKRISQEHGLAYYWEGQMVTLTGKNQYPITIKEKGQMARICKFFIGEKLHSLGPLEAKKYGDKKTKALIDFVLTNWNDFTTIVRVRNGMNDCPTAPHIGFFSKYFMVADDMMCPAPVQSIAKPKPKPVVVEEVVVPKKFNPFEEEPYHPSAEEVAESLESFKSLLSANSAKSPKE